MPSRTQAANLRSEASVAARHATHEQPRPPAKRLERRLATALVATAALLCFAPTRARAASTASADPDEEPDATPDATPATTKHKSPWHLELDVGLPLIESQTWLPNVEPTVSYATHRFSVGASGALDVSTLNSVPGGVRNVRGGGEIFGAIRSGDADSELRFELGAALELEVYHSLFGVKAATSYTEKSLMLRPTLSGSLAYEASERLSLSLRAALGVQRESFQSSEASASAANGEQTVTATFHGALGAEYELWPAKLTLRLESQVWAFRLRRSEAIVGGAATGAPIVTLTEVEWQNMLFADLDALGFWVFKPSLHVGLSEYALFGPVGNASGLTASVGVGLVEL
jgi:hypothetical protein